MFLPLLRFVVRKMMSSPWILLCLLIGMTMNVALFSTIPLYSHAVVEKMLQSIVQDQEGKSNPPGWIGWYASIDPDHRTSAIFQIIENADKTFHKQVRTMGPEIQHETFKLETAYLQSYPIDAEEKEKNNMHQIQLIGYSKVKEETRLIDGRYPVVTSFDEPIEVVVSDDFLLRRKRDLNSIFLVEIPESDKLIKIKPVGVITSPVEIVNKLQLELKGQQDAVFVPIELFKNRILLYDKLPIKNVHWQAFINPSTLEIDDIGRVSEKLSVLQHYDSGDTVRWTLETSVIDLLRDFSKMQSNLNLLFSSLFTSIIILLLIYLLTISNKYIEGDLTEISIYFSRGASRKQIFKVYACVNLILGIFALPVGIVLGRYIAVLLGEAKGFLSFVHRAPLKVDITSEALVWGLLAVIISIVLVTVQVILSVQTSIVEREKKMAREEGNVYWHRYYLDLILVGASVYTLYQFNKQMDALMLIAEDMQFNQVDPLLFMTPALFAFGLGLLFLRLYPHALRLVFMFGRKYWSVVPYLIFVQASRATKQVLNVQIFLVLSLSTGVYGAVAARTINQTLDDNIRYMIGSDFVIESQWDYSRSIQFTNKASNNSSAAGKSGIDTSIIEINEYIEPPFTYFTNIKGVISAAKVFRKDDAEVTLFGNVQDDVTLLAIDTYDFGMTAWMRKKLLDHHINAYLNLIAQNSKAVLISRSIANEYNVHPGDSLAIGWNSKEKVYFQVYGIIDYWPSWNPIPYKKINTGQIVQPKLIVANLKSVQERIAFEPYQVWLKTSPDLSSQDIFDELSKNDIHVVALKDTRQELVKSSNSPYRLLMNGVMTLGFTTAILISFIGGILFWLLTLKRRTHQYGALRAYGVSNNQLRLIIAGEQAVVSGFAVFIGVLSGGLVSYLFVPLFRTILQQSEMVPPFQLIFLPQDTMLLLFLLSITILIGFVVQMIRIRFTRVDQALKLGGE